MADPNAAAAAAPIYVPAVSGVRSQINTPAGVRLSNPNASVRMDVDEIDLYTTPLQIIQPSGRTTGVYQSESLYNTKTTDGYFRLASTTAGYDGHIKIRREQEFDPFSILQVEESAYGFKPQHPLRDDGRSLLPVDTPMNEPIQYQEIRTDYDAFTFQIPALLEVCELLTPLFENPVVSTKTASGFGTRFAKGGLSTRIGQLRYACVMLYTFNSTIMDDPSTIVDPHKSTSYLEYIDKYIYNYEGRLGISVYPTMYHKVIAPFEAQIVYENTMIPDAVYDQIVNGLQQVMGEKSYTRLGAYVTCLLLPNLYLNSRYTEAMREFAYLLYNIAKALPIELRIGNNGSVTKFGPGHTKFYTSRGKAVLHPKQPLVYLDMEGKDLSQKEIVAEEEGVPDEREERRKDRLAKIDRAVEASVGKSKYYQLLGQLQQRQREQAQKKALFGLFGNNGNARLQDVKNKLKSANKRQTVDDVKEQLKLVLEEDVTNVMDEDNLINGYMMRFIQACKLTKGFGEDDDAGFNFLYQVDPDQHQQQLIASQFNTLKTFPGTLIDALADIDLDRAFDKNGEFDEKNAGADAGEAITKLKLHIGNDMDNISEFIIYTDVINDSAQSVAHALSGIEDAYQDFSRVYSYAYEDPDDEDKTEAIQKLHQNYENILKDLDTHPKAVKKVGMMQIRDEDEFDIGMNSVAILDFIKKNPTVVNTLIHNVEAMRSTLVKYSDTMDADIRAGKSGYMVANKGETNIYMDPAVAEELMERLVKTFEDSSKAVQDEIGALTEVIEKQNEQYMEFSTNQTDAYKDILSRYEAKRDIDEPEPNYDEDYAESLTGTIESQSTASQAQIDVLADLNTKLEATLKESVGDDVKNEEVFLKEFAPLLDELNELLREQKLSIVLADPYDPADGKYRMLGDTTKNISAEYTAQLNALRDVYQGGFAGYSKDLKDIKELIAQERVERKAYIDKSNIADEQKNRLEITANMQLLQFIRDYQSAVQRGDMPAAANLKTQYENTTNQMQQNNIPISRNNARLMNDTAHAVQVMGDTIAGSVNKLGDIMIEYLKFLAADSIDQTIETLENIPAFDLLYVADAIEKKMLGDYQNSDDPNVQKYFADFNSSLAYLTINGDAFKDFKENLKAVYEHATESEIEQTVYQLLSRVDLKTIDYDSIMDDKNDISTYEFALRTVLQTFADIMQFSEKGRTAVNEDKIVDYYHEYSVMTNIPFETLANNSALQLWDSKYTEFKNSQDNPNFYRNVYQMHTHNAQNVLFDKNGVLRSVVGMRPISKRTRKENESMLVRGVKGMESNLQLLNRQVRSHRTAKNELYNGTGDGSSVGAKRAKSSMHEQNANMDDEKETNPFAFSTPEVNSDTFK
jgi:hypothetical protein